MFFRKKKNNYKKKGKEIYLKKCKKEWKNQGLIN